MTISEWIAGAGLIVIVGMILKNRYDYDHKIGRVYQRLDSTKDYQETNFTRKDICAVLHKTIDEKLDRMEIKIDTLLKREK